MTTFGFYLIVSFICGAIFGWVLAERENHVTTVSKPLLNIIAISSGIVWVLTLFMFFVGVMR